jgi:hypothetical protein
MPAADSHFETGGVGLAQDGKVVLSFKFEEPLRCFAEVNCDGLAFSQEALKFLYNNEYRN